jgi:hypothetical protein
MKIVVTPYGFLDQAWRGADIIVHGQRKTEHEQKLS